MPVMKTDIFWKKWQKLFFFSIKNKIKGFLNQYSNLQAVSDIVVKNF